MSEQIIETHRCNCGEGNIYVKKVIVTGMGPNQSQPMEGIAPCRVWWYNE